jgi:hypothetical protein
MNHPHKEDGKVLYTIKPGKKLDRTGYFENNTLYTDIESKKIQDEVEYFFDIKT